MERISWTIVGFESKKCNHAFQRAGFEFRTLYESTFAWKPLEKAQVPLSTD